MRERKRVTDIVRKNIYSCFILILKGMTGALAPFSYLVSNSDEIFTEQILTMR